jgi:NADPH-ferrihemoprotein reductase
VIFVVATYGEGEPTDNARDFYEWLTDQSHPSDLLQNVKYTVFGLGNKTYEHYNLMGRVFDQRLAELGATRIVERGEGDDDSRYSTAALPSTMCIHCHGAV